MKKKLVSGVAIIMALVMIVGVCSSVTMSYAVYSKMQDGVDVKNDEKGDETREKVDYLIKNLVKVEEEEEKEFVTIGSDYEVTDTKNISDAYISGDVSGLSDSEKKTYDIAKKTLESIVNDKMSIYQKEEAVYDWLGSNVTFNTSSLLAVPGSDLNTHTPYGVLTGKTAVCVGFATTFKLFMNMLGLDCMVMHDKELSHSWDIVKLDDDQWYMCDVTLDDRSNGKPIHKYFNCTSAQFSQNHEYDDTLYPVATGTKYNYAAQHARDIKDVKKIPSIVKKLIDGKKSNDFLRLPKNADMGYIQAMVTAISERTADGDYCVEFSATIDGEGHNILCIYVTYYNDDSMSNAVDKYEGLRELIDSVFGAQQDMGGEFAY